MNADIIADIIIIGAGLSGLYCCNQLLKLNDKCKIILLESSNRIGGRTMTIDGFDLGGQWIGKNQSEILKLIKRYSLTLIKQKYSKNFLSKVEVEFVGTNFPDNSEFHSYLNGLKHIPLDKKYANISVYDHIVNSVRSEETVKLLDLYVESSTSVASRDLNMLFFLFDVNSSKHKSQAEWYIKGGVQQLSECLYEEISDKISSHFLTTVKRVKHDNGKCTVFTNKGQFTSNKVVFCLSPVCIKKITNDFPLYKKQLFGDMIMPTTIKIVLVYEEKFWSGLKVMIEPSLLSELAVANILEGPNNSLVCLITGRNAVKFQKLTKNQRYKLILQQINILYSYTIKPLMYYEKVCKGCYAGTYKPGKYHNYFKLSHPIGTHYYFAGSDVSSEFYGYLEGAIRASQKVVNLLRKTNKQ